MQVNPNPSNPQRLIRLPEVEALIGLRKSSIYDLIKKGSFPAPLKLTEGRSARDSFSVQEWISERIKDGQNHG